MILSRKRILNFQLTFLDFNYPSNAAVLIARSVQKGDKKNEE